MGLIKKDFFYIFRRWIRLLFGREFVLQDLLVLWDSIFADSSELELVDYVYIAMLHHIRDKCNLEIFLLILLVIFLMFLVLNQDYCQSMQVLMKYPHSIDVYDLINLALHYKDPKVCLSLKV